MPEAEKRDPGPPFAAVDILARIAVQIRTQNITYPTVLYNFTRAGEMLNWIDESGGWTPELKAHFAKRMQFYG